MAKYEPGEPQDSPEEAAALQTLIKGKPKAQATADKLFAGEDQAQNQSASQYEGIQFGDMRGGAASFSQSGPMTQDQKAQARQNIHEDYAPARDAVRRGGAVLQKGANKYNMITDEAKTQLVEQGKRQSKMLDDQVQPLVDEADEAASAYKEAQAARVKYRAEVQNQIEEMDRMAKTIASEQPHNIWTDASVPIKIAGIAAMSLGAAAQAIYGDKTNAVTDQIEAAVKQDLTMQRMRLEKGQKDYANRNLLLNRFMVQGDHIQNAEDKAFSTSMMGIKGRLEAMMPLLKDPQMRQNLQKTITELEMKSAAAQQRVMENTVGYDIRQAEAEAAAGARLETARGGSESAMLNAKTRASAEQRLSEKQANDEQQLAIPDWETPDGKKPMASPKEMSELRETEEGVMKATNSLDQLVADFKKGNNIFDLPNYLQMKSDANRAIVKLKGKGIVNAGANFTKLEEDLIKSGYMSQDGLVLKAFDKAAVKMIRRAEADLWEDVRAAMDRRNLKPSKSHRVLGGSDGE